MVSKSCYKCKENKDNSEFYRCLSKSDGLQNECKLCSYKRGLTPKSKLNMRKSQLKTRYNITPEVYNYKYEQQEERCAICLEEQILVVDHCHRTGRCRGLLCAPCNKGLGFFRDNFIILENAAEYVRTV